MSSAEFVSQLVDEGLGLLADDFTLKYHARNHLHYHNCVEIGLCTSGSGVCFVKEETIPFIQGQTTFIRPGEVHIFQSSNRQPSTWFFLYVSQKLLQGVTLPVSGVYKNAHTEKVLNVLREHLQSPCPEPSAVRHLVGALPGLLGPGKLETTSDGNDRQMEKIAPALEYISQHYDEKLNIDKLASLCYLSESFFRLCFRKATKDTPHAYLTRVRLAYAKGLLLSTKYPILKISQMSRFESLSSFNRSFRTANNLTPREYRSQNLAQGESDAAE